MIGTMLLPSGPSTVTPNVVVYLRPSLKMCPTSIDLMISSGSPHPGQGSPALTSRRSSQRPQGVARSTATAGRGVVDVGSGGHVAPAAQREVGDHRQAGHAHRAEAAG